MVGWVSSAYQHYTLPPTIDASDPVNVKYIFHCRTLVLPFLLTYALGLVFMLFLQWDSSSVSVWHGIRPLSFIGSGAVAQLFLLLFSVIPKQSYLVPGMMMPLVTCFDMRNPAVPMQLRPLASQLLLLLRRVPRIVSSAFVSCW